MSGVEFVIITPAFNEADYIGKTIKSVLRQTRLPLCWLIVDDGSTDNTSSLVQKYASTYNFIRYHRREKQQNQEYFASNVFAIMEGVEILREIDYNFLAILDADILLPQDYYDQILSRFSTDDSLGVASGIYENLINGKLHKVLNDRRSTPKAIQVFRRDVFEKIGGYLPLPYGGEDTVACFMARMNGWKVWSFPEIKVIHLRPTGTGATDSFLKVRFRQGICEYHLATQPLFFFLKSLRRSVLEKPYVLGGMFRIIGYLWAWNKGEKRLISDDIISFIREDQWKRIWSGNKVTI